MKFSRAIDEFIADWWAQGRMRSPRSEVSYRATLNLHGDDVNNRDPRTTNRDDVKRTLNRWSGGNPNSLYTRRAHLVAFYTWAMEEGYRKDNPAAQTRRPRRQKPSIYRLTRAEAISLLQSTETARERRAIYLMMLAGIRNAELRGMQGRHFQRPGWVWVSDDIGKGAKERWIPVTVDLEPTVEEIRSSVGPDEYIIPAERWRNPGINTLKGELSKQPASRQVLRSIVMDVSRRSIVAAHITPHSLRHAFGDHVAKFAGLKNAQWLMGHSDVSTTEATYTGAPTLDELADSIAGFSFLGEHSFLPPTEMALTGRKASTGIEPVEGSSRTITHYFTKESVGGWDWMPPAMQWWLGATDNPRDIIIEETL